MVAGGAVVFLSVFAVFWRASRSEAPSSLDAFARCLTEKGAVMYGAYWCPHCQNQKAMFGDAVKFIRYVECTEEPQTCTSALIRGFPTWIFPASPASPAGLRLEGTQPLESLAEASGCPFPAH